MGVGDPQKEGLGRPRFARWRGVPLQKGRDEVPLISPPLGSPPRCLPLFTGEGQRAAKVTFGGFVALLFPSPPRTFPQPSARYFGWSAGQTAQGQTHTLTLSS